MHKKEEVKEDLIDKTEDKEEDTEEVEDSEENIKDKEQGKEIKTKKKKDIEAIVNIYTSFNNTIAHVTDMAGVTISKVTGGMVTKNSRLKANPTVAMFIAKKLAENIKDSGITSLYIKIRAKTGSPAPGPGANAIIKSLSREGFKIISIIDSTRVPRGGPKKKGGRRGRRP